MTSSSPDGGTIRDTEFGWRKWVSQELLDTAADPQGVIEEVRWQVIRSWQRFCSVHNVPLLDEPGWYEGTAVLRDPESPDDAGKPVRVFGWSYEPGDPAYTATLTLPEPGEGAGSVGSEAPSPLDT